METQNKSLDLFQGNTYHPFNLESGFGVYNMFLNEINQMKSFWGYKETKNESFATGKYLANLITKNGKNLIIADEEGIIILQYNPITGDFLQPVPKLFFKNVRNNLYPNAKNWNPNPNGYSITENETGIIYITDGSIGGLYILYISYLENGEIDSTIYFTQFPYNQVPNQTAPNVNPLDLNNNIIHLINPAQLEYFDTHIIIVDDATGGMYVLDGITIADNGTPINPLNFTGTTISAEIRIQSIPCNITSVKRINRELHVIGTRCIETWYSVASDRPIARYPNKLQEVGAKLRNTIVKFNGKLFFLGSSDDKQYQIYLWNGDNNKPTPVIKNNLNYLFVNLNDFSSITFTAFGTSGQEFGIVNFGGTTNLNFSILINFYTQDSFYLVDTFQKQNSRFLADDIFRFQDQYFFISWNINRIYKFEDQYTSYNGHHIDCSIRTNQFFSENNKLIKLSNCNINFAPIPSYYYSQFIHECIPVLQDNTNTSVTFLIKDENNKWKQFNNGFFKIDRKTFHRLFKENFVTGYNPQIIIKFYQATAMQPFVFELNKEQNNLIYFPIILNSLQITAIER